MPELDKWYDFRRQMVDVLEADLMGGPVDAELDEPPLDRFVLGILHPQDGLAMDEDDSETDSAETGTGADTVFDPAVALARMRYPSSMGMTFAVDSALTPDVLAEVGAARYRQVDDKDRDSPWIREQVHPDQVVIGTRAPGARTVTLAEGLDLYFVVRPPLHGIVSITVVLVNTLKPAGAGRRDDACWFQPRR